MQMQGMMWKATWIGALMIGLAVVLWDVQPAAGEDYYLYPDGTQLKVISATGEEAATILPLLWGPDWAYTSLGGQFEPTEDGARTVMQGEISGTNAPFRFQIDVSRDAQTLRLDVRFNVEADADLTHAVLAIEPGAALQGADRATVREDGRPRSLDLPLGVGQLAEAMTQLELRDGEGRAITFEFDQPVEASQDQSVRILLASDHLEAGDERRVAITLSLPDRTTVYLIEEEVPRPHDWDAWFEWTGTGDTEAESVIDMTHWLDAPAGRLGRIERDGNDLLYDGEPMKFWGLNVCFMSTAPPRDLAQRRARFYAKYGINAVRLHKFADGYRWNGILAEHSARAYKPEDLDRMDYFVHQLKERGIYTKLSAVFGQVPLGPDDAELVPYIEEFYPGDDGWASAHQGAVWFSQGVQDVLIEQMTNLLEHENPHTGMRYADDPAIMAVEMINENSALFYTTMDAMRELPTIRQLAGEQFFNWLRDRYGSEAAMIEAWGGEHYDAFANEGFDGEGWEQGLIYPVGNPWYWDPDQLEGQMSRYRQRLLDTMVFLYERQNAFFDRFEAAIRATGYVGELLGSNWQAGRAYSHFLNLHADYRVGLIDRHNYFDGHGSMLHQPGSGTLSAGMQQVEGRPFMLSEWIHVFPNEFGVEGPAIIGAYGLGLNDWDVSFMFQNEDPGGFRSELGERWDVVAPQIIGVFPAVARQVMRGDVTAADQTFTRKVHVPSVKQGQLGFEDTVEQDHDVKTFGSDAVPASTLAIGRSVVEFTQEFEPTPTVDLEAYVPNDVVHSATSELSWRSGEHGRDGHVTIDTAGTQAVVGFAGGRRIELEDVVIEPATAFAAIYVTALERDEQIPQASRLLVTTLARVYNDGMRYIEGHLVREGEGPMRVEPVEVTLDLKREKPFTVHILDHDGRRTGETIQPEAGGRLTLDGARTQAVYYEIVFDQ